MAILDIRRKELASTLAVEIWEGLNSANGTGKTLPTMLLYDEKGLQLYEEITYLDEYYLTNTEIEILTEHASAMAQTIEPGTKLVELGSGNLRKITILLDAIEQAGKDVEYYALDISLKELDRTIAAIPSGRYRHVHICGLLGTYDDGFAWLRSPEHHASPIIILTMGSSIGNFPRGDAVEFLRSIAKILKGSDRVMVAVDGCHSSEVVHPAYNDRSGKTHEFIRNGLTHANNVLGQQAFNQNDWEVRGVYSQSEGRHTASFRALRPVRIGSVSIREGEQIQIEESNKYNDAETRQLFQAAGLVRLATHVNRASDYSITVLRSASLDETAARNGTDAEICKNGIVGSGSPVPPNSVPPLASIQALRPCFAMVTKDLPPEVMYYKPIDLRYQAIFYLGHVPAFWELQLSAALEYKIVDWEMANRFRQGIDPKVKDPKTINHSHSKEPAEGWGSLEDVRAYGTSVDDYIDGHYREWVSHGPPKVWQALWEAFEHEAMHIETSFYGLIRNDKALPVAKIQPDFVSIAKQAEGASVGNEWINVTERTIKVGTPRTTNPKGPFCWDNETPERHFGVKPFKAKARGITVGEYAYFMWKSEVSELPACWVYSSKSSPNGHHVEEPQEYYDIGEGRSVPAEFLAGKWVRTVFGPQPLAVMLSHPFMGSYHEVSAYASAIGGRIPTREEEESIYAQAEESKATDAQNHQAAMISAVNGHLCNSGVEESPPLDTCCDGKHGGFDLCAPGDNYANLKDCNVGMRHFHTTPITHLGNKLCGRCENGGTWMWTSSVFEAYPGFTGSTTYPGYSVVFFKDRDHNVVLGGSWATHPQLAGRKSFVNFFQRGYEYAWIGARVVKDL